MDRGECTILVLLDLSAAFDLVDHDILIKRFNVRFGLNKTVLESVRSYLSDRTQVVSVDSVEISICGEKTVYFVAPAPFDSFDSTR